MEYQGPLISIILPVLNEEAIIRKAIERLRPSGAAKAEIIVVDGDPSGSTISKIDHPVIKIICQPGRGRQMNRGAAMASGRILLFLHADTILPKNALLRIADAMTDERIAAGAFDLGIGSIRPVFRITEQYVRLRTRLTRIPFGDQAIFIRSKFFFEIGGYRDIPIMEDVELMGRIKKNGARIHIIPDKVMTSARRWEREGVLCCTFRNWTLQIAYLLGVPPETLKQWYH